MGEKRRSYPEELKRNSLGLLRTAGKSVGAVALDLGINYGLLNRCRRKEAQEGGGKKAFTGQVVPRDEEVARFRREKLSSSCHSHFKLEPALYEYEIILTNAISKTN